MTERLADDELRGVLFRADTTMTTRQANNIVNGLLANPDVVLRALGVPFRTQSDGTIITLVTELRKDG